MIFKIPLLFIVISLPSLIGFAKVSILTTTANLKSITEEVGKEEVSVTSLCKGTHDPHFLEAKPSYILKTSRADLVISIGLGLEVGWLPKVLAGGRNLRVMSGKSGNLEVGKYVSVLEVPTGSVTRADGDVHPEGNPHIDLDPIRAGVIAEQIAKRLAQIDPKNGSLYSKRALALKTRLAIKTKEWQKRILKSGHKKVVTHHKTLTYFFDRFGIKVPAILEPLPGISPTAPHILSVIKTSAREGVRLILVENFFDHSAAKRVARDVPGVKVKSVPVAVGGAADVTTIDALYENLVRTFENGGSP